MESNRFLAEGDLLEEGELVDIKKIKENMGYTVGRTSRAEHCKKPAENPYRTRNAQKFGLGTPKHGQPPPPSHTSPKQPFLGDFDKV